MDILEELGLLYGELVDTPINPSIKLFAKLGYIAKCQFKWQLVYIFTKSLRGPWGQARSYVLYAPSCLIILCIYNWVLQRSLATHFTKCHFFLSKKNAKGIEMWYKNCMWLFKHYVLVFFHSKKMLKALKCDTKIVCGYSNTMFSCFTIHYALTCLHLNHCNDWNFEHGIGDSCH